MLVSKQFTGLSGDDKAVTIVDSIVFFVFVSLLVCRLFVIESFYNALPVLGDTEGTGIVGFGGRSYIFSCSMILLTFSAIWLFIRFWRYGAVFFRVDVLLACFLLLIGLALSFSSASNRYQAIIEGLNLVSIVIAGLVMVDLLKDRNRRLIFITVLISLACSAMYRCYQQKYYEQNETVAQMESDYYGFMDARGLDGDSWQARQLQERILSKDSGGYFTISNTAASYFVLALAGGLCMIVGVWGDSPTRLLERLAGATVLMVPLAGIYITGSTGGKLSSVLVAIFILIMWYFRRFRCRKCLFFAIFIMFMAASVAVVAYGLTYDRLPTSNLWIRWQYWQATAQMIADNWLMGVGPGNFGIHYLQYMNPASPEAVKDPHNVALSILGQWGIFGFGSMVWMALTAGYYLVVPGKAVADSDKIANTCSDKKDFKPRNLTLWVLTLVLSIVLANIFSIDNTYGSLELIVFIWIVFSRALLFGFLMCVSGYCLLCGRWYDRLASGSGSILVLVAVLAGFFMHNSIDFAFFSPAVCMLFFFIVALALAIRACVSGLDTGWLIKVGYGRLVGLVLLSGIFMMWFGLGAKVYKSENMLASSANFVVEAGRSGRLDLVLHAADLAEESWRSNRISPYGLSYSARILGQLWRIDGYRTDKYFDEAITNLQKAQEVDRFNPDYSRQAGELWYQRASRFVQGSDKSKQALSQAADWFEKHLAMYPGNAEVMANLAEVYDKQGKKTQAIELARQSLAIEKECMELQPKLFPHRKEFYPRMDIELQEKMKSMISE